MIDTPPSAWDLVKYLALALAGVLQAIFGYQILRIRRLEEMIVEKADSSDLTRLLTELKSELSAEREAAAASREALHEKVNAVAKGVAFLEGRSAGRAVRAGESGLLD